MSAVNTLLTDKTYMYAGQAGHQVTAVADEGVVCGVMWCFTVLPLSPLLLNDAPSAFLEG